MRPDPHISDAELLMAMDGELDEPRNSEVRRHLAACWECRGRRTQFEKSIADFMAVYRELAEEGSVPPGAGPTARLRATLAQEALHGRPSNWGLASRWRRYAARPVFLRTAVSATAIILAAAVFSWVSSGRLEAHGPLPDSRLTPGAVRFISKEQVCRVSPEDEGRTVPADLAHRVFEQYRITNPKPRAYELDYLISPALGGTTALQNLWPVPYSDGQWTSRVKDALEERLRTLVCDGKLDLSTAQREIATNWIAAYQKYFQTTAPVAAHAYFVKDSPWE